MPLCAAHRRLSLREAFQTKEFWFRIMSFAGFLVMIAGLGLLADGNGVGGYLTVSAGLALVFTVNLMEFFLCRLDLKR